MTFSLTNYTTALSPALLKKAGKCTVRECDETAKGTYVGYVDEGGESYDVSLTIAVNKDVAAHRCDCGQNSPFCQHKAALLLTIAKGKKTETKIPAAKGAKSKGSKAEALLEEADAGELKEWIKSLLLRNKDLEMAFVQRFGERKTAYTKAEAEALTADAAKSVVKSRTRIEQSELKKIVELWSDVHKPIVQRYTDNVMAEDAFIAFDAVLDACLAFAEKTAASGTKISHYVTDLLNRTVEPISVLYEDEAFERATGFYIKRIPDGVRSVRLHYIQHLQNVLAVSKAERVAAVVERLLKQYGSLHPTQLLNGAAYTKALFALVEGRGLLPAYFSAFKPIKFDNAFNLLLIEKLIEGGEPALARKYCEEQMAGNYKEAYNLPYLALLRKLFTAQNDEEGLADVAAQLLPFTFDFDDYLFLYNRMPEGEEKKKWRTKMITKSKNASSWSKPGAKEFYFRLLAHEQAYKKMIDSITSYTPYGVIADYIEPMLRTDKAQLLKALLDKSDDSIWGLSQEERTKEDRCFPEMQAALLKQYTPKQLLTAIQQAQSNRFYFRGNRLIDFLKKHLIAE